jgi:RNA polymerase sigma-70 factor (family 1)
MSKYSNHTDQELVFCLNERDHSAFTEIYSRYWKKMLLIAWNHCKDKDAAKDIVHDVFTSLWEKHNAIEIENLPAFLATAVKFGIFKYYQKEQRRTELAKQNYAFDELTHDEAQLDAMFLQEYIDGIVEKMPDKCRLVFKYSRDMGLKNSEIASEIQISEKGVERNLTRALKIIRGELKNYGMTILLAIHVYYSYFK